MTRSINGAGLDLIEKFEVFRATAYMDKKGGKLTIGFGHTRDVQAGDSCTLTQAQQWLGEDVAEAEKTVQKLVTVPLTDNQYAALVSFAFNVGFVQFAHSTLRTKLNSGDYGSVPHYLSAWVFVDGKVSKWQVARRAAEAKLWNTP